MQYEWLNDNPSALSDLMTHEFGIANLPQFELIAKRMASTEKQKRFARVPVAPLSVLPEVDLPFICKELSPDF